MKAMKLAVALAVLTMLPAASMFADSRPRNETWRNRSDDRYDSRRSERDRRYARTIHGIVHRVDFRRGRLFLRDRYSRRLIRVDMTRTERRRRSVDLEDLRRGDRVTLAGDWTRSGVFRAYRIESVRSGRYNNSRSRS